MKAIILAAGLGTRLRPITNDVPKCMVSVNGQPIIDKQINNLIENGLLQSDIVVVGGYKGDILAKHIKELYIDDNDNVISVGGENFSEGQIKSFISQAHVLIARILEKDGHWHCFVQTFKGLKGEEPGKFGSQSHLHYTSDKFYNLSFDDLIGMLRNGNYPNGSVHIPIVGYGLKGKSEDNE